MGYCGQKMGRPTLSTSSSSWLYLNPSLFTIIFYSSCDYIFDKYLKIDKHLMALDVQNYNALLQSVGPHMHWMSTCL